MLGHRTEEVIASLANALSLTACSMVASIRPTRPTVRSAIQRPGHSGIGVPGGSR